MYEKGQYPDTGALPRYGDVHAHPSSYPRHYIKNAFLKRHELTQEFTAQRTSQPLIACALAMAGALTVAVAAVVALIS